MKKNILSLLSVILLCAICLNSCGAVNCCLQMDDVPSQRMHVGDTSEEFTLIVTGESGWKLSDVRVFVANDSIVRVDTEIKDGESPCISFRIVALKVGVTEFYFETKDGSSRTEAISVLVMTDRNYGGDKKDSTEQNGTAPDGEEGNTDGEGGGTETAPDTENNPDGDPGTNGDPTDGDGGTTDEDPSLGGTDDTDGHVYVLNTKTKKIHHHDCYTIRNLNPENRAESSKEVSELEDEGYTTCGICFK